MPIKKDPSTPPPMIGKIGPYTVFMTPPSTPSPKPPTINKTANDLSSPVFDSPKKVVSSPPPPPPVQPPPLDKSVYSHQVSDGSVFGFLKNAAHKFQNAHSSLDDHLARWFGLNQSKYQWALDDYYATKGLEKEGAKAKDISNKVQSV